MGCRVERDLPVLKRPDRENLERIRMSYPEQPVESTWFERIIHRNLKGLTMGGTTRCTFTDPL